MSNENKKYFIIPTRYEVKYSKMFNLEEAMTKVFHLNALNEDEEKIFHLQEVGLVNSTKSFKQTETLENGSAKV